jgi:hypothetical protein
VRTTGGRLAGLAVTPGKNVVVSEERLADWERRRQVLDFGSSTCFLCRPFLSKTSAAQWLSLVNELADLQRQDGVDLAVLDPLATFLPGQAESNAGLMLDALVPLRQLTDGRMAVLLLHHPRKGVAPEGQAARGTGSLTGFVDILVEMRWHGREESEGRRRVLQAWSRFDPSPPTRVIELTAEGTDYLDCGTIVQVEFHDGWDRLRLALEGASDKLTQQQLLQAWPPDDIPPSWTTLWRWLDRSVSSGLVLRQGAGRKDCPFRYWLPGQEDRWRQDPLYVLRQLIEQQQPIPIE